MRKIIEESYEEIITDISSLDNNHYFTVARIMENGTQCVELHYNDGIAHIEYGTKEREGFWSNEIEEDINWFNLELTNEEVLSILNQKFDNYFKKDSINLEIDY